MTIQAGAARQTTLPAMLRRSPRQRRPTLRRVAAATLLAGLLAALLGPPLLRLAGAFLVLEQPAEPAAAIVVLSGGYPRRELAAADLYRQGLAPVVMVVPEWEGAGEQLLPALGVPTPWELRLEVLKRSGVPSTAIVAVHGVAYSTVDELRQVAEAVGQPDRPVLLVSSKYHGRRVALTWRAVSGGSPRGIVRAPPEDRFNPDGWWRDHRMALQVLQEYGGLVDAGLGFPMPRPVITRAP